MQKLLYRESRSTNLTGRALALEDVGAVGPVFMATVSAAQDVDVLVVVRAGKRRGANHNLSIPVPVACSARPFTHRGQFTYLGSEVLDLLVLQSRIKPPPTRRVVLRGVPRFPSRRPSRR